MSIVVSLTSAAMRGAFCRCQTAYCTLRDNSVGLRGISDTMASAYGRATRSCSASTRFHPTVLNCWGRSRRSQELNEAAGGLGSRSVSVQTDSEHCDVLNILR